MKLYTLFFVLISISVFSQNQIDFTNGLNSANTVNTELTIPHYKQNDPAWSGIQLGSCVGETIGKSGCAIACLTSLLKANGADVDPAKLNTFLKNNSGYSSGCLLIWSACSSYPNSSMTFNGTIDYSLASIKKEIDKGIPVIVNVMISGVNHFVIATGYTGIGVSTSDFSTLDPLKSSATHLSDYSTIVGLRTFKNVLKSNSGFASVSSGIYVSPSTVVVEKNFTCEFTLKETQGSLINLEAVTVAIFKDGVYKFDFPTVSVNLSANGTYTYKLSGKIFSSLGSGNFLAVARGKVAGGNWFDFSTIANGKNSVPFTVVSATSIVDQNIIATNYELFQNYPNPFNPITLINYSIPVESKVKLIVFNSLGQIISVLVDEVQTIGKHNVVFNACGLSSGVYFYSLTTMSIDGGRENFLLNKKMMLIK